MLNNYLQILFLDIVDRNNIPVAGLYLLLFVGITFVVVKLSNDNYLRQLISLVSLDGNKFETQSSNFNFSKSSFFLHVSLVILFTIGFSILTNEFFGSFNFMRNFIAVLCFYVIQVLGFVIISSLISNTETSFVKHRLSYNELISFFLFPFFLVSLYSPVNLSVLVLIVMASSIFIVLVRVSIYLTRLISIFHIILYLCTLEIIPILFLLKFIFN